MIPVKKAADMTVKELAAYIDHSVLKPEFTNEEIVKHITDGVKFGCKTVCINPNVIETAKEICEGSDTGLCVVCDFPFGMSSTSSRVKQAEEICKFGVEDLDIVAHFGLIRSGMYDEVERDLKAVIDCCHSYGTLVKTIFETDSLSVEQVVRATEVAIAAGTDFVKTSTGFLTGFEAHGATPEIVKVMLDTAAGRCKVKGAGCIRTREHFLQLIDMGIDRMGVGFKSTPIVLGL